MSQGDSNPAAIPHAAEDIQGDDRWMSQVKGHAFGLLKWDGSLCFVFVHKTSMCLHARGDQRFGVIVS
jgi:hypothetical protein